MLNNFLEDLRFLPRKYKKLLLIISDFFLVTLSSVICEFILTGYISPISRSLILYIVLVNTLLLLIFLYKNNYSFATRYFDTTAISSIFFSSTILVLVLFVLSQFLSFRYLGYNFIITQNLIFIFLTITARIFFKYVLYQFKLNEAEKNKSLIFGASTDGIKFLKQNKNSLNIIGFIDEDINKIGALIENTKVYSIAEVKKILQKNKIHKVFICAESISEFKKNEIVSIFNNYNIAVEYPNIDQNNFFKEDGNIDFGDYDNYFDNKTILITGCAGTIGQEIFLRLLNLNVNKVYGIDKNEETIASLKINLKKNEEKKDNYQLKLIDICNKENCETFFRDEKIDIIFHAAAYKHVDIVEENPNTAIFNNIVGLHNIIELSKQYGVENFVFVSTDKAVNPSNTMGSTKRMGEIITKYYKNLTNKKYISVRFGNVIGSSGSLLQILKKQLAAGGPITLTHPEATRYFMTIKEAVSLVLKSTTIKNDGDIYVLKMGDPINIYNLIKQFLKSNNLKEKSTKEDGIEIRTIGLRAGEKLHEELFYDDAKKTEISSILKENIQKNIEDKKIHELILKIKSMTSENISSIKNEIKKIINDFSKG